jgi:hypothetical protein
MRISISFGRITGVTIAERLFIGLMWLPVNKVLGVVVLGETSQAHLHHGRAPLAPVQIPRAEAPQGSDGIGSRDVLAAWVKVAPDRDNYPLSLPLPRFVVEAWSQDVKERAVAYCSAVYAESESVPAPPEELVRYLLPRWRDASGTVMTRTVSGVDLATCSRVHAEIMQERGEQ